MNLQDLETPAAVIDLAQVKRNAERVANYAAQHQLKWRPHVKTHKCREIAELELRAGASGVTVATPREAEVMASVCDDILLAYPPVGAAKLERLMALPRRVQLSVALDSRTVLDGLARACLEAERSVDVLIELDVGARRVGVEHGEAVAALAEYVCEQAAKVSNSAARVRYRGLLFHPGHIHARSEAQTEQLSALTRRLSTVYAVLERRGLSPAVVSGGNTPTLWRSHEVMGLTEIRAGTYIFNDRDSAALGVAADDACAYSILATVVSTAVSGQAVVDAGSKALAKEVLPELSGFGTVLEHPEVTVSGLSEEHGILDISRSAWRPQIGERVRLIPNHVCVSVNLQDRLWALEAGGQCRALTSEARGRGRLDHEP